MKKKLVYAIFPILFFGAMLRFFNLSWGQPFYFHPDERNIANAIVGLDVRKNMNPHFFAYGHLPLYASYFLGLMINFLQQSIVPNKLYFEQAIINGRLFSAALSTLCILLPFLFQKEIKDKRVLLFASFYIAGSVGLIQYAHFSTVEIWLTLFTFLFFYFSWKIAENPSKKTVVVCGLLYGLLLSIKISSAVLFLLPIFSLFFLRKYKKNSSILSSFSILITILFSAAVCFFAISPFIFIDPQSFIESMRYEGTVAAGTSAVFYTQGFIGTLPIIYQLLHVYPFLLNPFFAILFPISLLFLLYKSLKEKNSFFIFLLFSFAVVFFSQAFFFVKWTRYIIPTLPFIYMIISLSLPQLFSKRLKFIYIVLISLSVVYSFSFFKTVYLSTDTRITASNWAKENITSKSNILSETYDLGILPFNNYFPNISLVNFYNDSFTISYHDYVILPSDRISRTRKNNPSKYPNGNNFYNNLFNEKGYKKIYETPCDIFCRIVYSRFSQNSNKFSPEETVSVFDRPSLFIFKKT